MPPASSNEEDMRKMADCLDNEAEFWVPVSIPKEKCRSTHCNFTSSGDKRLAPYCCGTCRMIDHTPPDETGKKQLVAIRRQ